MIACDFDRGCRMFIPHVEQEAQDKAAGLGVPSHSKQAHIDLEKELQVCEMFAYLS
jgi:hypothetical protein